MEKTRYCPDEAILIDYLYNKDIGHHVADCPWCIEQIVLAYESEAHPEYLGEALLPDVINRAKNIAPAKSGVSARTKSLKRNLWLVATVAAFALSFIFPRHFLQFLAAAMILGMKWVAESDQIRTLIVTLDSRREKKDSDIPSNRLKSKIGDHSA